MSTLNLTLKIWRQKGPSANGKLETYMVDSLSTDMSFLEMLDVLNDKLTLEGKEPVAFDHDCREGICGTCGSVVNGHAHGPEKETTLCQLHLRHFKDGDTIVIEPFRGKAIPIHKDLLVDRSSLDAIMVAGGYVSVNTGGAPDGNAIPISQSDADRALDVQPVSVVVPVWQHALMQRQYSLLAPRSHILVSSPKDSQRETGVFLIWYSRWMNSDLATTVTSVNVSQHAPRVTSIRSIARMNRDFFKAVLLSEE